MRAGPALRRPEHPFASPVSAAGRAALRWLPAAGAAGAGVGVVTGLIALVPRAEQIASLSMLYLLVVIGMALRFGSGPAVLTSLLSFLAFDWFFTAPRYVLTAHHPGQWLALGMFLVTALVVGQLTARLQASAAAARQHAREAVALSRASWAVASQVDRDSALVEVLRQMIPVVEPEAAAILRRGADGVPEVIAWCGERRDDLPDFRAGEARRAVEAVLESGRAEVSTSTSTSTSRSRSTSASASTCASAMGEGAASYWPLRLEERVLGVLYLGWRAGHGLCAEEEEIVASLANHAAVVLERDRLARAETDVQALAESDRLKTALLSMVSHNFRSPLAAIKASVGSLIRPGAAGVAAAGELLQGIDHEVDRLNRMVANLLALSRLEAAAWRVQRECCSVAELVGAAYDACPAEERARIRVLMEPPLPEVCVDPVQIAEALGSLLDNALRYSPPGSPVELRAAVTEDTLVLTVLDRGPGLPPGEEARVFERFYRGPGLRESARPGMGLGLSIARGLVEAHDGRLTAANREGGGARFELRVPR